MSHSLRFTGSTRFGSIRALVVPFLGYLVFASYAAYTQREQLNTDAISYLRHAFYLASGRVGDSISGYWSPLLIWSLAPVVGVGMDGVYGGHLVMVIWGGILMLAAYFFMRRFTGLDAPWDMVVMLILALKVATWLARWITPDITLASALLFYSGLSLSPSLLRESRIPIAAGLLGGIAYLAKSYGLPFFLAHFTFIIALRFWLERSSTSLRQAGRTWLIGMVAFLVVAGPWMATLSLKYGRPTFSTAARVAHTIVGPRDMRRAHPIDLLRTPPPGRLTVWEVPDSLPYNPWSPLANADYFKHQLNVVRSNAARIIATFNTFDLLRFFPAALVLLPLVYFQQGGRHFQTLWLWSAVGIYAGGFLPLGYETRYIYPYIWPICFFYLFGFLLSPAPHPPPGTPRGVRVVVGALKAICLISFAGPALYEFQELIRNPATPACRQLAAELKRLHCPGPIAISPGFRTEGLLTAYHLSEPFLGPVGGTNTLQIEAELQQHGAGTLLVRETKWDVAKVFLDQTSWRQAGTFDYRGVKVHILTNAVGR